MKKQLMRVVTTTFASKFFKVSAVVLMLTASAATQASPVPANPDPAANKAVIRHLATTKENIVFEVKIPNESGEKFTIVIKDNTGTTLYRNVYNQKDFNKKFSFPKSDADKLVFIVKDSSGNKTESFEINSNTRLVEEVVVTRVK